MADVVVTVSLEPLTGRKGGKRWVISVRLPAIGAWSLPYEWRTKALAMPTYRLVRNHLRSSIRIGEFAAKEAIAVIAQHPCPNAKPPARE